MFRGLSVALLALLPTLSFASDVFQLDAKGNFNEVTIPPNSGGKTLTAYAVTNGNESQFVNFSLIGPAGIKVKAQAQVLVKGSPLALLNSSKGRYAVPFLVNGKEVSQVETAAQSSSGGGSSSGGNPTSQYYCLDYTAADLDEIISILSQTGTVFTRDELCALYGGNSIRNNLSTNTSGGTATGDATAGTTSVGAYAILRKDTCSLKKNAKTLIRFDITLAGVSPTDLAAGFKIRVSGFPLRYAGGKAATVKPTSDGKFAPRALFLLQTTGFSFGSSERMSVVRWSKGRYSARNVKVEDYVFYRGKSLARAVAEPHLRGGKASVELQSDAAIYSVCFKMVKARQRVNGYTN